MKLVVIVLGILLIGSLIFMGFDKDEIKIPEKDYIKFYEPYCSNGNCRMIESSHKYAIELYGEEVAQRRQEFFNKINMEINQ